MDLSMIVELIRGVGLCLIGLGIIAFTIRMIIKRGE